MCFHLGGYGPLQMLSSVCCLLHVRWSWRKTSFRGVLEWYKEIGELSRDRNHCLTEGDPWGKKGNTHILRSQGQALSDPPWHRELLLLQYSFYILSLASGLERAWFSFSWGQVCDWWDPAGIRECWEWCRLWWAGGPAFLSIRIYPSAHPLLHREMGP